MESHKGSPDASGQPSTTDEPPPYSPMETKGGTELGLMKVAKRLSSLASGPRAIKRMVRSRVLHHVTKGLPDAMEAKEVLDAMETKEALYAMETQEVLDAMEITGVLDAIEAVQTMREATEGGVDECIEDTRRHLALSAPSTDIPWEGRIAEARAWCLEVNEFITKFKRRHGCATHELVLPDLIDLEDPTSVDAVLELHKDRTAADARKKAAAATAIARCANQICKDKIQHFLGQGMQEEDAMREFRREFDREFEEASIVRFTAENINYYHTNVADLLDIPATKKEQVWSKDIAAEVVCTAALATYIAAENMIFMYLAVARRSPDHEAIGPTDKALRATAAMLVSDALWMPATLRQLALRGEKLINMTFLELILGKRDECDEQRLVESPQSPHARS